MMAAEQKKMEDDILFERLAIGKDLINAAKNRQEKLESEIRSFEQDKQSILSSGVQMTSAEAEPTRKNIELLTHCISALRKDLSAINKLREGLIEAYSYTRLSTLPAQVLPLSDQTLHEECRLKLDSLVFQEQLCRRKITSLEKRKTVAEKEVRELKQKNEDLENELRQLQLGKATQLQNRLRQLESELQEKRASIEAYIKRLNEAKAFSAKRERIITELEAEFEACRQRLIDQQKAQEDCELQLQTTQNQLTGARRELQIVRNQTTASTEVTRLRTELAERVEEISKLQQRLATNGLDLALVRKYVALSVYFTSTFKTVYASPPFQRLAVPFSIQDSKDVGTAFINTENAQLYTYFLELLQALMYDSFTQEAIQAATIDGVRHYIISADVVTESEFGEAKQLAQLPVGFVNSIHTFSTLLLFMLTYNVITLMGNAVARFSRRTALIQQLILSGMEKLFEMFIVDYNVNRERTRIHLRKTFTAADYQRLQRDPTTYEKGDLTLQNFIESISRNAPSPELFVDVTDIGQLRRIRSRTETIRSNPNWLRATMSGFSKKLLQGTPNPSYPILSRMLT